MAHKTALAACKAIREQTITRYAVIITWKKDWERWQHDIISSIDTSTYNILKQPIWRTRNQLIIASAKTNTQMVNV